MAWRKPELRDLAATLNQKELDMFRAHPDFKSDADPVQDLILRTASFVRGFCRRNKQVTLSPEEHSIPESLISAAMDYAAFDVLKRLPLEIGEARKDARDAAMELLKDVASGAYTPESYSEDPRSDDTSSNLAGPSFGARRRKLLNKYPQI